MTHPLLLALALTGAVDAAAPAAANATAPVAAPPAASDTAPPAASATAPAAASARAIPRLETEAPRPDRRGWRHALGLGLHATTFSSEEGSQYSFRSASLGYLGSVGARGAFLHAFFLVPLQARQDGHVYDTASYYRRRAGGDLLLGWHWRWSVGSDLEAEAGPGLHGTLIYLPGKVGYRDFSALPLGLGAGAALWRRTGAQALSRSVTVGAYASAAFDFRDPMHADDLAHGFTVRAGLTMGLGARR